MDPCPDTTCRDFSQAFSLVNLATRDQHTTHEEDTRQLCSGVTCQYPDCSHVPSHHIPAATVHPTAIPTRRVWTLGCYALSGCSAASILCLSWFLLAVYSGNCNLCSPGQT